MRSRDVEISNLFVSLNRISEDISHQVSKLEAGYRDLFKQLEEVKAKNKRDLNKAKLASPCECGGLKSRLVSLLKGANKFGSKEEFVAVLSEIVMNDGKSTSMDDLLKAQSGHNQLRRNSSHLEVQTQENNKSSSVLYQFLQRMPSYTISGRELATEGKPQAYHSTQRAVHLTGKGSSGFSPQSLGSGRIPHELELEREDSLNEWIGREGVRLPPAYDYSNKHSKYASRSVNISKRDSGMIDSIERMNIDRLEVRSALQNPTLRSSLSLPKHFFDTQPNHSHSEHFEASSNQTISISYNRHPVARRIDFKNPS